MEITYLPTTEYHGFERINFTLDCRDGILVRPKNPLPGNPTCWRAEFFGAFDTVDVEMLKRGWQVCYFACRDMYGCDEAVELFHNFHDYACEHFGFPREIVLFGFSRGGLYSVNYAAKYPDRVKALYLDAPVLDIKSWPCANLESREAKECLEWYKLTPETLAAFDQNPLDKLEKIKKIPTIIVAGDSDKTVPYVENGAIFASKLAALGGTVTTIIKPGCDHHPHSLEDPTPVADFIERYTFPKLAKRRGESVSEKYMRFFARLATIAVCGAGLTLIGGILGVSAAVIATAIAVGSLIYDLSVR